jgi:dihydrofolate reductase
MPFSLIAAVARNRVIGDRGKLPWRLPDDMARFRRLTMGHPVLMGRATFVSLGTPLSGRRNIVLTRDAGLRLPGCEVVHSVAEATATAGEGECFIIGGAAIYAEFLPRAQRMYLTLIDADVPGDTLFPDVPWSEWSIVAESAPPLADYAPATGPAPAISYRFVDYERIRP